MSVRRQNDAPCPLEGVRRTLLTADGLEFPGTPAARGYASHLGESPVGSSPIVNDAIPRFVGLYVEMSATSHAGSVSAHLTAFLRALAHACRCHMTDPAFSVEYRHRTPDRSSALT